MEYTLSYYEIYRAYVTITADSPEEAMQKFNNPKDVPFDDFRWHDLDINDNVEVVGGLDDEKFKWTIEEY